MQQRLSSLYQPPILFAHRGASAHAPENTTEAFRLALKLGATGLETDCWVTKDKQVVLDHDGLVQGKLLSHFRSNKIKDFLTSEIDPLIPTFVDLLAISSPTKPLSIDVLDADAMSIIDRIARETHSTHDIYICHDDLALLASWKQTYPSFKYVNSIRLDRIHEGPEQRYVNLAKHNVDVLNMHHTDWNGGFVSLAHRFNLGAFSWGLQHTEQLCNALLMGVDAVYSDWSDRMADAYLQVFGSF